MTKTALPRTLATALCKTRNWLLVEQAGNDIYWCGTEDNMLRTGEHRDLADMLDTIQSESHSWMLQALSEPAVGEDEIGIAMDFLFPLNARAALGDKMTPKSILRELYRYVDKALTLIGETKMLRGYPNDRFDIEPAQPVDEPLNVNKYPLFLCDDKIEAVKTVIPADLINVQADTADNLWWNQALKNLFPAKGYFQKFCGQGAEMWFYNMASIDDITSAELVYELELAVLDDYLQSDKATGSHVLYRVCSADEDVYVDMLMEEADYKSRAVHSLETLNQKLCALCNRPKSTGVRDVDITRNATGAKKELLRRHLEDAAAPFVRFGWGDAEWLQ